MSTHQPPESEVMLLKHFARTQERKSKRTALRSVDSSREENGGDSYLSKKDFCETSQDKVNRDPSGCEFPGEIMAMGLLPHASFFTEWIGSY